MPAVTQTNSNFLGGVSRQNDDKKLLNQVTECINGYPDPTYGLLKRPSMKFINQLKKEDGTTFTQAELADAAWFFVERDAEGSYVGAIKDSNIYVWTVEDGTWCPVTNNAPGYLSGINQKDYHFRNIQDTTIITNRTVSTGMELAATFTPRSVSTIKLINLNEDENYVAKIQGQQVSYTATSTDTFDTFLQYNHTRNNGTNNKFAEDLVNLIKDKQNESAVSEAEFNAFKGTWYLDSYINSIVIRRTNAGIADNTHRVVVNGMIVASNGTLVGTPNTPLSFMGRPLSTTITGKGGLSNLDLEVFQDSVANISDLPIESFQGHNVEILNNDTGDDNYYVKFIAYNGISGPGYWNEALARNVSAGFNVNTMPHELVDTGAPPAGNNQIYETIGLESWINGHNAPLLFTQALDDDAGGVIDDPIEGSGRQITWLRDYTGDLTFTNSTDSFVLTEVNSGGHAAFTLETTDGATLQAAIREFVDGANSSANITSDTFTIVPADGETYTVDGTSYPVMGSLYVPTNLTDVENEIDVVVVFHGTIDENTGDTIQDAAEKSLEQCINQATLNLRDKIIFAAAYPQDHISSTDQYNLPNVGVESATFLMGDNLPYARAAVKWVKNSLDGYMSGKNITNSSNETIQIEDVYLLGHSQGGKLVCKMNTLETGIKGVIANAPGPIQWDQTCSNLPDNYSCSKIADIYGSPGATTFTFGPMNWVARETGDDKTSPIPSFIGDPITSTFYYNNRLGFLSTDNINFSVANDPFNFFVESALTQVDSDPVDLNVSSVRPVSLSDVLPSPQGLLVFSERQQFQIYTTDGSTITPSSTVVRAVSNYETDKNIAPVDIGTTAAFVSNVTGYSKLFTLQLRDIEQPPIVVDISKVVLDWIPDTIDNITVSPQNSVIVMIDRDTSYLYLYRYYNDGEKDLFQAWTKWQLPGTIQTAKILNDSVIIVSQHENEYTINSITLDEIPSGKVITTATDFIGNSCLDMATRPVSPATGVDAVVYDSTNDITKIYVPYTPFNEKTAFMLLNVPQADVGTDSVIDADAGYYTTAEERTETGTGYRYFEVKGDFTGYADGIIVGYGYDFEVTLPKFYYRLEPTVTDFTAPLTVSRVKFSVGRTGAIQCKVKADGSNEWKPVDSTTDGDRYHADSNPVKTERQLTVPIHQRNTNFELKVTSNFPYPVSLVSMTWEGIYSPRFYRRA